MNVIVLSSHTEDMVRHGQNIRQQDYDYRKSIHTSELNRFRSERNEIRAKTKNALKNKQFGTFIISGIKAITNALRSEPASPVMAPETEEEMVWKSGNHGENQLLSILDWQLNADWTALTGYRNRRGEADLIIVGPQGLLGIEIKHINGLIRCEGDYWYRDKYDNYDNPVEWDLPITDRRGRSPAQQINEVCDDLLQFLNNRRYFPFLMTAVVLTHPKSWVGEMQDLTVGFVWRADSLDVHLHLQQSGQSLVREEVTELVNLIIRDHEYHAKRRATSGRG